MNELNWTSWLIYLTRNSITSLCFNCKLYSGCYFNVFCHFATKPNELHAQSTLHEAVYFFIYTNAIIIDSKLCCSFYTTIAFFSFALLRYQWFSSSPTYKDIDCNLVPYCLQFLSVSKFSLIRHLKFFGSKSIDFSLSLLKPTMAEIEKDAFHWRCRWLHVGNDALFSALFIYVTTFRIPCVVYNMIYPTINI